MLATPMAPDAGGVDRRFLLDGAYRSHGSLSLAERSEYGLCQPPGRFERIMSQTLTSARANAAATVRPLKSGETSVHRVVPERPSCVRSSAKYSASRMPQTISCNEPRACTAAHGRKRPLPHASASLRDSVTKANGARAHDLRSSVRFRVLDHGCILVGIVYRGELVAARQIDERRYGSFRPDRVDCR